MTFPHTNLDSLKDEVRQLKQEILDLQKSDFQDKGHDSDDDIDHHYDSHHCDCHDVQHTMDHKHNLGTNICDGFFVKAGCKIPMNLPPFCDNRIRLRLGGLIGNLNFLLFRQKGCRVRIDFDCNGDKDTVRGIICNVGTDFLDILQDDKTVITILQDRINRIHWEEKDCNPCHCGCEDYCCDDEY